jgi:hypothetical protein
MHAWFDYQKAKEINSWMAYHNSGLTVGDNVTRMRIVSTADLGPHGCNHCAAQSTDACRHIRATFQALSSFHHS